MDVWDMLSPTLHHLIMTDTIKPQELATFALPGVGWSKPLLEDCGEDQQ